MSYELRLMLAIQAAWDAGFVHFAAALETELRNEYSLNQYNP